MADGLIWLIDKRNISKKDWCKRNAPIIIYQIWYSLLIWMFFTISLFYCIFKCAVITTANKDIIIAGNADGFGSLVNQALIYIQWKVRHIACRWCWWVWWSLINLPLIWILLMIMIRYMMLHNKAYMLWMLTMSLLACKTICYIIHRVYELGMWC